MKNTYNKGTFRCYERGKIPPYLKKYGNKKYRRTERSEIEDQLNEIIKFRKSRKKKRKTLLVRITRKVRESEITWKRKFPSEDSLKKSVSIHNVIRYFRIKNKPV
ncbi:putative HNH restriction endonuclease [Chryseobacterium defluvii]|uniref:Putative HNH restriction endonuclease n=1 Tax=Chryseobacterium defluvii TaxID=160396 RepID=A0A840KJ37_9FLAO|nr:hypothetical protein [Chryseobacterium defluvii]MBB4807937.1 putative HNH restriction endonuclease [Chryseobacterium defluvii]